MGVWMRMTLFGVLVVVVTMTSSVNAGWPARMMMDHDMFKRTSCVGSAGKCYNTAECCTGYLCATLDDQYEQNPEIPGYCARGKDLRTCTTWSDCSGDSQCVELERNGPRYCLPKKSSLDIDGLPQVGTRRHQQSYPKQLQLGGIGASCEDNSECEPVNDDGKKLCCQQIRMARQGRRRICDPVTPISICITSTK